MAEWEQCEKPAIERLITKGWHYKQGIEVLENEKEPLLTSRLKRALMRINSISEDEANEIINILKITPSGVEGSRKMLHYIKEGVPLKDKEDNTIKTVQLIDYGNINNNEFLVANQVGYPFKTKIPDIILYINGIPLVIIECKRLKKSWKEAYRQIKGYEKEMPELFKYVQFGVGIGDKAVYFPIVPWLKDVPVYEWKGESLDDLDNIAVFLTPPTLLDILRYFIFYRENQGVFTKVLPRYMQYRAVSKIVRRAVSYAKGEIERNRGLIWHWQGSGKTLTMIFSAYKIKRLLGNPTIFFIVDRRELEEQLAGELKAIGLSFEVVGSIPKLKEILMHSDGKRGIFVTLIHKFREEELREVKDALEKMSKRRKTIMNRRDVIAFIDEGHRTQYGELASTMHTILKKAAFFAFTGTPISKKERDTYATFGYGDEPYLDRYFIIDSIADGFTVKIAYQARLEERVHLKKDYLEAFLSSKLEEIPEEYRGRVKEELRKKLDMIKVLLKNPKRIGVIAEDIAKHYQENVRPFKAMVVAVDREACVLYKRALDRHLPPEYSEVVMTFSQNDPDIVERYHNELKGRFQNKSDEEIREEIVTAFRNKEHPKILIVTEMLLTGFDAPILQTMYLDKPLKEHRLLQAIARTNRPFFRNGENIKAFGLIVDYVGVFKELKKALEIYDERDIKGVAYDVDKIKGELRNKIKEAMKFFDGIKVSDDRETIMEAVKLLFQNNTWEEFQKLYKEIRYYYRLLKEDRWEFKDIFSWLTEVYYAYNSKVNGLDPEIEQKMDEFLSEALKFIHETVDVGKIRSEFPIIELDEEFLEKVMKKTYKERAFYDLLFAVRHYINTHKGPITEDLIDQVESIIDRWKKRKEDIERLYEEILGVAQTIQKREKERKALNLSELEYSLVTVLKRHVRSNTQKLIGDVKDLLKETEKFRFPRWQEKADVVSEVSRIIMFFLVRRYQGRLDNIIKARDEVLEVLKRWG